MELHHSLLMMPNLQFDGGIQFEFFTFLKYASYLILFTLKLPWTLRYCRNCQGLCNSFLFSSSFYSFILLDICPLSNKKQILRFFKKLILRLPSSLAVKSSRSNFHTWHTFLRLVINLNLPCYNKKHSYSHET